MKYQGINLENVKLSNRSSILLLLNNSGAMSRKDIAETVGLTAASVTLICSELLEEGLIVELGEANEEKRVGRKKILVDINPEYGNVLCIAVESDVTYISVTDMKGRVLCNVKIPTDKNVNPEKFFKNVTDECQRLFWKNGIAKEKVLGATVTIPGSVDRKNGISLNTYSIWNESIPVARLIQKELGIDVVVENNLKAYAQTEIYFGIGRTVNNFFVLKWGPGVGASIVIDGKIYQGSNKMAAEIGHMSAVKDGRSCNCGRKGCLETYVSTKAIMDDIKKSLEKKDVDIDDITMENPNVRWIITEKLDMLAHNLRNTISVLDPKHVVLVGYMFDIPGIAGRFIEAYKGYDPLVTDDFFVKSELSVNENHIEGLAVLLSEVFLTQAINEKGQ
ncbi:ROK family transcriptional regulator [Butyrivibrio sp. AE3004]|uniref:ROK family transcriptional regulator n=1 Tax=Butyrivibrio sp. AE3004 TaxID=1506994 RepID=UPI0004942FEE|nr:ROK family transcriptional regulator [Butyrivibrio sp. AE3004]